MICPYCEKERLKVDSWGSVDNEFDYSCVVCNLESINWMQGKPKHAPYNNPELDRDFKREMAVDNSGFHNHLKTIAERKEDLAKGIWLERNNR